MNLMHDWDLVEILTIFRNAEGAGLSPSFGNILHPEREDSTLNGLGVIEHWDHSTYKQYSRNLNTGERIELVYSLLSESSFTIDRI